MPIEREMRRVPLWIVLLGSLLLSVPFHVRPDNFIVDDGYFYPEIARFIAHGQGSTFNGIMLTNGYHPLWMLICVVAASLTSNSSLLLQLLGGVQDILLLCCIGAIVLMARVEKMRGEILGCMPILFFGMVLGIWRLLEADLALALQIAVIVVAFPVIPSVQRSIERRRPAVLGVLFGMTLLARLDLVFFVVVVLVFELFRKDPKAGVRLRPAALAISAVIPVGLLVPYLAWNFYHFHHLLPISGAIKSTFPHPQRWGISTFLYPVVGAIAINGALLFKRSRTPFENACVLTALAAFLHMAYTLSFGEIAPWYLTTGYLSVCLCIIWVTNLVLQVVPSISWVEPAVGALVFLLFLQLATLRIFSNFTYTRFLSGHVSFHGHYVEPKRALAIKLRDSLPQGSRMMIFDAPGGVAFYSGMDLIPVDGLVSDYAYNQNILKEGFAHYADREHIDYFISPVIREGQDYHRLSLRGSRIPGGQVMEVDAPLMRRPAGTVTLHDADLLFTSKEINPELESIFPEVGVWRIQH